MDLMFEIRFSKSIMLGKSIKYIKSSFSIFRSNLGSAKKFFNWVGFPDLFSNYKYLIQNDYYGLNHL